MRRRRFPLEGGSRRYSFVEETMALFSCLAIGRSTAVCKVAVWGVISFACVGVAQQPLKTLLVGVHHRAVTSLNGDWHYLVDQPPARGLYAGDGKVRDNGYALNTHPNITTGAHNEEYDFATAPTLKVPGDWNTQDPTLFRFEGVVWYQRDFEFEPKAETRTFLHVGAANYKSFVWVNQKR